MKKSVSFFIAICLTSSLLSCKSEAKKDKKEIKTSIDKIAAFSLKNAEKIINFTAYKTTEKKGVNGQFKKINIIKGGEGNTIKEAINNTEFSIPVSSIFTKDTSRDFKIKKFFFGMMDNTSLLSGKLMIKNDSIGYAHIKMNGITAKLPFTYTISNKKFNLKATINLATWNGIKALTSLNEACKDLHKGADGVSKTWEDVAINITSIFK